MSCKSCDLKRIYKLFEEKKRKEAAAAKEAANKKEMNKNIGASKKIEAEQEDTIE